MAARQARVRGERAERSTVELDMQPHAGCRRIERWRASPRRNPGPWGAGGSDAGLVHCRQHVAGRAPLVGLTRVFRPREPRAPPGMSSDPETTKTSGRAGYAPQRARPGRSRTIPLPARSNLGRTPTGAAPAARFLPVSHAAARRGSGPGSRPDIRASAARAPKPVARTALRAPRSSRTRRCRARCRRAFRPRPMLPAPRERGRAAPRGRRGGSRRVRRRG